MFAIHCVPTVSHLRQTQTHTPCSRKFAHLNGVWLPASPEAPDEMMSFARGEASKLKIPPQFSTADSWFLSDFHFEICQDNHPQGGSLLKRYILYQWAGVGQYSGSSARGTRGNLPAISVGPPKVMLTLWSIMNAIRLRHTTRYDSTATTMMRWGLCRLARGSCSKGGAQRRALDQVHPDQGGQFSAVV